VRQSSQGLVQYVTEEIASQIGGRAKQQVVVPTVQVPLGDGQVLDFVRAQGTLQRAQELPHQRG
jgi:hypothetical protein